MCFWGSCCLRSVATRARQLPERLVRYWLLEDPKPHGSPGALKLPLCIESEEGPDHKDLLYAALPCISARGCFQGNIELGVTSIPRNMFSILSSLSWMLPCVKAKALCALILTVAALSQNNLPYHAIHDEVKGNDSLFYCDQQYLQEFLSFPVVLLQCLIDTILQEPIQAAGANLALDACNAIASSFEVCQGASDICSKLVETAKLSLSSDNKYLQSTVEFLKNRGLIQRGEL
ncbi:hypothetical protein FXO38_05305 [Capsicum annuum]|nr:hypothetical protein FXO38_05305 [Capsicum annuum]